MTHGHVDALHLGNTRHVSVDQVGKAPKVLAPTNRTQVRPLIEGVDRRRDRSVGGFEIAGRHLG